MDGKLQFAVAFAPIFAELCSIGALATTMLVEALVGPGPDYRPVYLYTLTTPGGQRAVLCNYGAALVAWERADAQGVVRDVVLGYDSWRAYEAVARTDNCFVGVVVGRFANRCAGRGGGGRGGLAAPRILTVAGRGSLQRDRAVPGLPTARSRSTARRRRWSAM